MVSKGSSHSPGFPFSSLGLNHPALREWVELYSGLPWALTHGTPQPSQVGADITPSELLRRAGAPQLLVIRMVKKLEAEGDHPRAPQQPGRMADEAVSPWGESSWELRVSVGVG